MTSRLAPWQSLRTRATAFTLLVFVLGIWAMSAYVSSGQQASTERLLGEQQFSVTTAMAQQVDREMTTRMQALRTIAKEMDADLLRSPPAVQARLEHLPLLQLLFNVCTFLSIKYSFSILRLLLLILLLSLFRSLVLLPPLSLSLSLIYGKDSRLLILPLLYSLVLFIPIPIPFILPYPPPPKLLEKRL